MLRTGLAAFCCGIIGTTFLPVLPNGPASGLAALALFGLATGVLLSGQRPWPVVLAVAAGCLLLGINWHSHQAKSRLDARLPAHLEGLDLRVQGRIEDIPRRSGPIQQFRFKVDGGILDGRTIQLNDYGNLKLAAGQFWQLTVRLNRPHGNVNPGGFDGQGWMLQQGISARGYIRDAAQNLQLDITAKGISFLRQGLRDRLLSLEGHLARSDILLALMLGDRERISTASWQVYTRTGTNHLVVVSGLHIGFVAGLFYWLGLQLWRWVPGGPLRLAAPRFAALTATAAAAFYSLLAGFTLPTQRALIMVSVVCLARLSVRRVPPSLIFLLGLCGVLLRDPLAAISTGFWLSFTAVAGLMLTVENRIAVIPRVSIAGLWHRWGHSQWVVFVALLLPLSSLLGQFPLISPLANMLAIPLVSLVIVPLCLLAAVLLATQPAMALPLLMVTDRLAGLLWWFLSWLSSLAWLPEPWVVSAAGLSGLLLAAMGCLLLLLPLPRVYRLLAVLMTMPLLMPHGRDPPPGSLDFHVLDVGQGLAVVLRTDGRTLVYDTGPGLGPDFNTGDAILLPMLRSLGVRQVDVLVLSHGDNDHAGGAHALFSGLPVGRGFSGESIAGLETRFSPCLAGQSWHWGAAKFRFLHPPGDTPLSGNNASCVLLVSIGRQQVLLPGDIESRVELALLEELNLVPGTTVLIAPHHGSRTSSSTAFLKRVGPAHVVVSAGYRNRFNHPAPLVLSRYHSLEVQVHQTARDGMVSFRLGGEQGLSAPQTGRRAYSRYWY